jgi:hypothetical protein
MTEICGAKTVRIAKGKTKPEAIPAARARGIASQK